MERKTVIGAADLGHGWTKIIVNGITWRQPSVVGETRQLFDRDIKNDDVQYKGTKDDVPADYFIGNLALRHSKIKYAATTEEKAKNWTTKILLEAGLGITAANSNIYLVTGLPVDAYFKQKGQMEELLKTYNNIQPYKILQGFNKTVARPWIVDSKIVPQPLGAAMNYLLDINGQMEKLEEAKKKILVIDIGYYTLDLLILDAMEIGRDSSSPEGLGADTAYKLIQDALKEKLGKAPSRYDLDLHVRAKEYEGYNIQPFIDRAFEALGAQIDLEVAGLNTNFYKYIVTGGWGPKVANYLTIPKEKTVIYGQTGNVEGYNKIGRRTWRAV